MNDENSRFVTAPAVASGDVLCDRCAGCGKIANDDDGTPWKYWLELPVQSAAAIIMGLVKPVECPACHGTERRTTIDKLTHGATP